MRRRLLLVLASVSMVLVGFASAASANPSTDTGTQPLPGYTVNNPPLAPLTIDGQATTVLQGIFEHAAFDIEVPPGWNGQLVMYAHGYRGQGKVLTVDAPPFGLRTVLEQQHYAWAASSYYDNGYDVRAGVLSTHDLALHVADLLHRRPSRTYLVGVSMGGHVTGRSIEQYPRFYDAAMPMCGVLGDNQLFDEFLDENLVAQDMAGVRAYPAPADYMTADVPQIMAALGMTGIKPGGSPTNALGLQYRSIIINRTGGPRPGAENAFSFWYSFAFPFTLYTPDNGGTLAENPGRLAQNIWTRYVPNAPFDVNRTVQRVWPTDLYDRLLPTLTQSPQIFGRPNVPVLSLHDLGDFFVPFSMEEIYAHEVALHHRSGLVVQRAIRAANHCEFSNNEAAQGWNDLVQWVQTGHRPAGDAVANPAAVANPNFGCAFTDKSAWSATPSATSTRWLFPACPG